MVCKPTFFLSGSRLFFDRVPKRTCLRPAIDDIREDLGRRIISAKALQYPRQITLNNPKDRLVMHKKKRSDAICLHGCNRTYIVLRTKDINDIHNLLFINSARLGNEFCNAKGKMYLDELRACHSMNVFAAARMANLLKSNGQLTPSRRLYLCSSSEQMHYVDIEVLSWFENNIPGDALMKDIACGLELNNVARMPIRNSGMGHCDIDETTKGRSRFSTNTFGKGWYLESSFVGTALFQCERRLGVSSEFWGQHFVLQKEV